MSDITDEKFDAILRGIMDESPASSLLTIPGVYDTVSEHFNNEVLERWEKEKEEESVKLTELELGALKVKVLDTDNVEYAGGFYCFVDHENKLATTGFGTREALLSYSDIIRFDNGTVARMKSKYTKLYGRERASTAHIIKDGYHDNCEFCSSSKERNHDSCEFCPLSKEMK